MAILTWRSSKPVNVDAIADRGDQTALSLQLLDDFRLVGGQHVGGLPRQTKPLADGIGHRRVVARQHDGVANTHAIEGFNDLRALRPDTVLIGDEAGQLAIDGDIEAGQPRSSMVVRSAAVRSTLMSL